MAFDNRFFTLKQLDPEILDEVIREGEILLAAQFAAATASDQRALTWAGFVITISIGALAGASALAVEGQHLALAAIAGLYAVAIAIAGWGAIECARPTTFGLPGNSPINWLPEYWATGQPRDMAQARVEQANALQNCIVENRAWAERVGVSMQQSLNLALVATTTSAVFVALYVVWSIATL